MNLFKKIFLVMSSIVLLILLTMTIILIGNQKSAIELEAQENMKANLSIVMSQLEQSVQDFTSLGLSFSNNDEMIQYFTNMDLSDSDNIDETMEILKNIKASSHLLNNVTLTPRDGVIRLDALNAFYDNETDQSDYEYFIELKNNPHFTSIINKPLLGNANNEPIFGIGIQMKNDGEFLGVLGLPVNLNRLMTSAVIPDITDEDIMIAMVNSQGTIVWATDQSYIHDNTLNLKERDISLFNLLERDKKGSINKKIFNTESQIIFDYYEAFDIYVLAYKDIGPYNQRLVRTLSLTGVYSVSLLLLSSVFIYFILQRITKPIYLLEDYSNRIANEDFEFTISNSIVERKDELGKLGRAYQIMIDSLNISFKKAQSFGEKYHLLANKDELTGLPNRRNFYLKSKDFLDSGDKGSVIMMDLDNFKIVNDTLGHIIGDQVLIEVAKCFNSLITDQIVISRFGGDESIIYVNENKMGHVTQSVLDDIALYFEKPLPVQGKLIDIKFSGGISNYPDNSTSLEELIRQADIALYIAKNKGKNRIEHFNSSMEQLMLEKVDIENALKAALESDGFKLVYQPQVDLSTGQVVCYEALIRLKNSAYFPNEFIPVAEENLLILDIGRWVAKEAIEQIDRWKASGKEVFNVSINFSGVQLKDEAFCNYVEGLLKENDVEGTCLELEITENVFINNGDTVMKFFNKITSLGMNISIDDFGTGYSSLTYMIAFPVSKIKLDKQLMDKYLMTGDKNVIMKLIELIHSLHFKIVAEGIEDQASMALLAEINCDYIQGYYFSKPKEAKDILKSNFLI